MGLITCPDCGGMVSDRAAACPHCGCPAEAFFETREQAEPQEDYGDYGDDGYSYGGGPGILSGILKTTVGVAVGNKMTENAKQNYMGSPNCERAKTGRRSSCWGCGLADHCTMHGKH